MLNKRILVLIFLLLFLPLVGCLTEPNQRPIITSTPITTATVGVLYTYDVNATDPDGDALTYFLSVKPSGMTINSATGLIKWTPTATQVGDNSVTVMASDGSLNITQPFTIAVSAVEPEPEIELIGIKVAPEMMTLFVGEEDNIESVTATYDIRGTEVPIALGDCTFSSDDKAVVTVSDVGVVKAVAEGTARIVVSYTDDSITVKDGILVTVNPALLDHIVVLHETMDLKLPDGSERIESVTAYYNDGSTKGILLGGCYYESAHPSIATVSTHGLVTAKGLGTTTITVSYTEGVITEQDTIEVTVNSMIPVP